jgi:hypothetical protein
MAARAIHFWGKTKMLACENSDDGQALEIGKIRNLSVFLLSPGGGVGRNSQHNQALERIHKLCSVSVSSSK